MKGDKRCVEGRLLRHDPQFDDPYLETDVGQCPDCGGAGCEEAMTTPDDELLAQVVRKEGGVYTSKAALKALFRRHRAEVEGKDALLNDYINANARLTRERDEARDECHREGTRAEHLKFTLSAAQQRIDKLVIEAGAYDDLLAEMRQDRDAARQRIAELEGVLTLIRATSHEAHTLTAARAALAGKEDGDA